MEEKKGLKAGSWDNIEPYPEKIKFAENVPVVVKFADDFEKPIEMPDTQSADVFYIFNCTVEGTKRCISTSSVTLIMGLKGHLPLASKELEITKKNVGGKNKFYVHDMSVERPVTEASEEEMPDY